MPCPLTTAARAGKATTRQADKQRGVRRPTADPAAEEQRGGSVPGRPGNPLETSGDGICPGTGFSPPAAPIRRGGRVATPKPSRTWCLARRGAVRAVACQAGAVGVGAVSLQRECRTGPFRASDQRHTGIAVSRTDPAGAPVAVL